MTVRARARATLAAVACAVTLSLAATLVACVPYRSEDDEKNWLTAMEADVRDAIPNASDVRVSAGVDGLNRDLSVWIAVPEGDAVTSQNIQDSVAALCAHNGTMFGSAVFRITSGDVGLSREEADELVASALPGASFNHVNMEKNCAPES